MFNSINNGTTLQGWGKKFWLCKPIRASLQSTGFMMPQAGAKPTHLTLTFTAEGGQQMEVRIIASEVNLLESTLRDFQSRVKGDR